MFIYKISFCLIVYMYAHIEMNVSNFELNT